MYQQLHMDMYQNNKIKCITSYRWTQTKLWGKSFHKRRGSKGGLFVGINPKPPF